MPRRFKVILDSGAFSAWTRNVEIDLDAYIAFIKKHLDNIEIAVALDVIPGYPGKKLTPQDRNDAAKQSAKNFFYMLRKGVPEEKLMPVYHQGEAPIWLERMVEHGSPYIGISPANDKTSEQRRQWLTQTCNPIILDSDGAPIVKWHGFAVTAVELMHEYHWHSVDSATWRIMGGKFASIMLPKNLAHLQNVKDYRVTIMHIGDTNQDATSTGLLNLETQIARRIDIKLKPKQKEMVQKFLGHFGQDLSDLAEKDNHIQRSVWNGQYLFHCVKDIIKLNPRNNYPLDLYFATGEGKSVVMLQDKLTAHYRNETLPRLNVLISYEVLARKKPNTMGRLERQVLLEQFD